MIPPILAKPNPALPMYDVPATRPPCVVCGRSTLLGLCFTCAEWATRLLGMTP